MYDHNSKLICVFQPFILVSGHRRAPRQTASHGMKCKYSLLLMAVLLTSGPYSPYRFTFEHFSLRRSGVTHSQGSGQSSSRPVWSADAALVDMGHALVGPDVLSGMTPGSAGAQAGGSGGNTSGGSTGRGTGRTGSGGYSSAGTMGAGAGVVGRQDGGAGADGGRGGAGGGVSSPSGGGGVCSDTCSLAVNGICEDGSNLEAATVGGRAVALQIACDFGTDCSDCGPYKGVRPTWGKHLGYEGPIEYLRRQGLQVWAKRVAFEPYFVFAYTNPKEDLDVSEQVERAGCFELGIVQVFMKLLKDRCAPFKGAAAVQQQGDGGAGSAPLVVDVGANFGYYTVLSAAMGCRVLAVEPVPRFLAFLHWNLAANGFTVEPEAATGGGAGGASPGGAPGAGPSVRVVERVVSNVTGVNVTMAAPRRGVWGAASVAGMTNNIEQDLEHVKVATAALDDLVGDHQVAVLKVDVEGYEPVVFRSAERLLTQQRAENVLFEYSPGVPELLERSFDPSEWQNLPLRSEDPPAMMLGLLRHGYSVVNLPDNFAKSGYLPSLFNPIPAFEEVTERNLLQDLADVAWFRNHSAAGTTCPWPEDLLAANSNWKDGCFRAPDDSHPKGLRGMFSFNTNIWASRNRTSFQIRGPVGLFRPEQDEKTTWWSESRPEQGVGNRACPYLPANRALRSRCRCPKPEQCGTEQEVLLKALQEGRMPLTPSV